MKRSWLLLAAVIVLVSCGGTSSGSTASLVRLASPSPTANPADAQAVDLRIHLDLLLGEHAMIVAKQAAAAQAHNGEFTGYAMLLTTNGNEVVALVGGALGNQAAAQLKQAWDVQNGYLADYTIGIVTHNAAKANGAASGLQNGFVPQFAQVLASLAQVSASSATQVSMQLASDLKAMLDFELGQAYGKMYPQLRTAYADAASIGDPIAARVAREFPDKFPGDPTTRAADARVSLNMLLQEHAYLATMATDATTAGRGAEQPPAASALASNADALAGDFANLLGPAAGAQFAQVWGARDSSLIGYAMAGDVTSRQNLAERFTTGFYALAPSAAETPRNQVVAMIKVIDDQRGKSYATLAGDDRAAATAMQPLADRID